MNGQLLIEYNDGNYLSSTHYSEAVSALSARLIADVSIPPGEARYVQMDAAPQTVSVIPLDGTDCYPENNSFEVLFTYISIE